MRLRHIPGSEEMITESPYVIQKPWEYKGRWAEAFGSKNPVEIEVGMGKGKFLMELAGANRDINYVGIEMYSSVLLKAIQRRQDMDLSNLWFLRIDARTLADVFAPGKGSSGVSPDCIDVDPQPGVFDNFPEDKQQENDNPRKGNCSAALQKPGISTWNVASRLT